MWELCVGNKYRDLRKMRPGTPCVHHLPISPTLQHRQSGVSRLLLALEREMFSGFPGFYLYKISSVGLAAMDQLRGRSIEPDYRTHLGLRRPTKNGWANSNKN